MPHQLTKFITFTTVLSQPDQDQSFLFDALNLLRILFQIKQIRVIPPPPPPFFIFCVIKHLAALFDTTIFYTTVHTITQAFSAHAWSKRHNLCHMHNSAENPKVEKVMFIVSGYFRTENI
jgi:hypothetical protein